MDWWQDVLERTSWLELIAAFVSVFASVWIALWIQRRDFRKRTDEALSADKAREAQVAREARRVLVVRAFDLVADVQAHGKQAFDNPQDARAARHKLRFRIEMTAQLFALEPDADASLFALAFEQRLKYALDDSHFSMWDSLHEATYQFSEMMISWYRGTINLGQLMAHLQFSAPGDEE